MRLVRLLLVLAVIMFGVSRGLPWVMAQLNSSRGVDTESPGGNCAAQAQLARDDFGRAARGFRNPPYDLDAWDSATMQLEGTLGEAASACYCSTESCNRGQEAVDTLRGLIDDFGSGLRGETMLYNLANRMERVDDHLDAARAAARNGN